MFIDASVNSLWNVLIVFRPKVTFKFHLRKSKKMRVPSHKGFGSYLGLTEIDKSWWPHNGINVWLGVIPSYTFVWYRVNQNIGQDKEKNFKSLTAWVIRLRILLAKFRAPTDGYCPSVSDRIVRIRTAMLSVTLSCWIGLLAKNKDAIAALNEFIDSRDLGPGSN